MVVLSRSAFVWEARLLVCYHSLRFYFFFHSPKVFFFGFTHIDCCCCCRYGPGSSYSYVCCPFGSCRRISFGTDSARSGRVKLSRSVVAFCRTKCPYTKCFASKTFGDFDRIFDVLLFEVCVTSEVIYNYKEGE